ncbi:FMRFamide receptor [Aphis craccivora]|uniref:FMRFamide receptor n=1 Tax=Aphis craccivora TaxID=307492 RepID=A0A6G0ZSK9_APHCR|nr:FMRFamide receptor [Aphis craccivora]
MDAMNSSADNYGLTTVGNRSSSPFPEWSGGGNWSSQNETTAILCPLFESTDDDDYNLLFEFVTYGVLLNVIGVFGILGNVISMVILSRPQMKSSINYLLIGLARCDTVLIVTSMLLFGLPVVYPATGHLFNYYFKVYPLIAPVVYPIAMISQTVSVYLTLTVTLERFVAVCHPLRARSLCTYGRARAYVVATIAFAVFYNVTRFLEVTVQKCMHTGSNQYVYQVYPSDLRNDHNYISIYIHWMYLLIMYFIPFGSLAVLNAAIYRQVS